ncbi:signal peptidase I [Halorubrum lacusprofundi]|jgi:signal peptidase|uniref:signal peptidase I n=1 Tax=Halorubrum lacusprofundi TaxID=2247 RepID=UPI000B5AA3B9|nr:signal peptidase I [Halorubrum lacusprofundi]MCG1008414.1 signal peptidase I [Halorubrum lacusprofundi]
MRYRAIKLGAGLALLVVVTSVIAHAFPALVGAEYSYVVQSGSMEPAIGTGSVVFVAERPAEKIGEGDVITFADSQTGPTTTHRVIEKHQGESSIRFRTKGDANEDPDPEPVYRDEIVGVVTLSVPLIGYLIGFAQSQLGWVVLVVLPMVSLIVSELWELYEAAETDEAAGP